MEDRSNDNAQSKKVSVENDMDWISDLPDELLEIILSRLSVKEAVRASVLSHKWEKLWKHFHGNVEFEGTQSRDKSITLVNKFLNSHEGESVEGLRIVYDLDCQHRQDIDRWIGFAMTKHVRRFELALAGIYRKGMSKRIYKFPAGLLGDSSGFRNLMSLCLKSVDLSDEVVSYFLSNCPLLEQLSIADAPGITHITIADPKTKLKELEVAHCHNLNNLRISCPGLVSFRFVGLIVNVSMESDPLIADVSVESAPLLSSVSLGGDYGVMEFPNARWFKTHVHQIKRLEVDMDDVLVGLGPRDVFWHSYPKFCRLEHLEVDFKVNKGQSILMLALFLELSPRLRKFVLRYTPDSKPPKRYLKPPREFFKEIKCHGHKQLKVIEFHGWLGIRADIEFFKFLLGVANSLEMVVIDTRFPPFVKKGMHDSHLEKMKIAEECVKNLVSCLSTGVSYQVT